MTWRYLAPVIPCLSGTNSIRMMSWQSKKQIFITLIIDHSLRGIYGDEELQGLSTEVTVSCSKGHKQRTNFHLRKQDACAAAGHAWRCRGFAWLSAVLTLVEAMLGGPNVQDASSYRVSWSLPCAQFHERCQSGLPKLSLRCWDFGWWQCGCCSGRWQARQKVGHCGEGHQHCGFQSGTGSTSRWLNVDAGHWLCAQSGLPSLWLPSRPSKTTKPYVCPLVLLGIHHADFQAQGTHHDCAKQLQNTRHFPLKSRILDQSTWPVQSVTKTRSSRSQIGHHARACQYPS